MMEFLLLAECNNCDEEIFYGPCVTLIEHDGLPVITYDFAAQTVLRCDSCGTAHYSGDFELFTDDE